MRLVGAGGSGPGPDREDSGPGPDHELVRVLYDEHAGPVYAFCLRFTGDAQRAEDVVQEVFLRAWRTLSRVDLQT